MMTVSGNVNYAKHEDGYSVITLDRANKRNAINQKMVSDFKACLKEAREDECTFLVVTGEGDKMFCAGGDLIEFHGDLLPDDAFTLLYGMKEVLFDLASFPVPTICLLNGNALGGGCEIATACDFRIAKEGSTFGFIQTKLGIIPGWGGGTLLYEKVPNSFAYHWLLHADIHDASYLRDHGWIHNIIPREEWENMDKIIEPYVNRSLEQMRILKSQYHASLSILSLSDKMNEEVRHCANLWDSKEHQEAVQQFLARK